MGVYGSGARREGWSKYDPTPEEIDRLCAEIRKERHRQKKLSVTTEPAPSMRELKRFSIHIKNDKTAFDRI